MSVLRDSILLQPFYVPPPLVELSAPDPITELPFNAKPLLNDVSVFLFLMATDTRTIDG